MPFEVINGCQAAAIAAQRAQVELVAAYPITPQTTIVETLADFGARGKLKGEFVSVESEYSALACCNGAAAAGARVFTATASHGLAYMHEMIHWCSGARFPIVMVNVNRALGAPWCLDPDQVDSLSQRDTGWMQIYCANGQEVFDTVLQAFLLSEELLLPSLIVFDGFYISHTYEPVDIPDEEEAAQFIGPPQFQAQVVPGAQVNLHGITTGEAHMQLIKKRHEDMLKAPAVYAEINRRFAGIFGRSYEILTPSIPSGAKTVFLTAGSMAETVKWFLPELEDCGLIQLRMFRPFPAGALRNLVVEHGIERIVVIDRNCSPGAGGIFAQETRAALYGLPSPPIVGDLVLAGGVDLTGEHLRKVLQTGPQQETVGMKWEVDLQ